MQNEAMLCVKELAERAAAADSHPGLHDRRAETIVAPPESSSCGGGGGGGASVQAHAPPKADHGVLDLDAPTPSVEKTPAAGSVAADDNISTLSAAKSAAKSAGSGGGGGGGGDGGGGRGCSRGLFSGSQPAVEGDGSQGTQPAFADIGFDVDDTMPCQ